MKKVLFIIGVFLLVGSVSVSEIYAQSPEVDRMLDLGKSFYEKGQFQDAEDVFRQLIMSGNENSALYYNLGNAHYNQGDVGLALLNYRKAQLLKPRDIEAKKNIEVAKKISENARLTPSNNLGADITNLAVNSFSINEIAIGSLLCWNLLLFGLAVAIFKFKYGIRVVAKVFVIFMLSIGLVSITLLGIQIDYQQLRPAVVMIEDETEVAAGPGREYRLITSVKNGSEGRQIKELGDWRKLSLYEGEVEGWVPADAVGVVVVGDGNILPSLRPLFD